MLAWRIASSRSSRSTSRSVKAKPLLNRAIACQPPASFVFCTLLAHLVFQMSKKEEEAHLSIHVLPVQSAYMRAAGSLFARKPTRCGLRSSFDRPSATSAWSFFAMFAARTTLHEVGLLPVALIFAACGLKKDPMDSWEGGPEGVETSSAISLLLLYATQVLPSKTFHHPAHRVTLTPPKPPNKKMFVPHLTALGSANQRSALSANMVRHGPLAAARLAARHRVGKCAGQKSSM